MKKKMRRKAKTCNKMKNVVKMNIMTNMSRKREGEKTKKKDIK